MWDLYPYPNVTYVNSTAGMFSYANTVTGGLFGLMALGGIWVVLFLLFAQRVSSSRAFSTSSLICSILTMPMWTGGLVSDMGAIIFVVMAAVGMLLLAVDRY